MNLVNATYTEMSPEFGQRISRRDVPIVEAARWLWLTHLKRFQHSYVKVQACQVPQLEPTGVVRIDKMLKEDSEAGFMSGNVSSNLQTSSILPAWSRVEVNGFTELDGKKIETGDLFKRSLDIFRQSSWNETGDQQVFDSVEALVCGRNGGPSKDESTTLVRIHHMRDAAARHLHKVPVIKHGWLLVGSRGQIHYRNQTNWSPVSSKLMARAVMVLSYERHNCQDLLKIEGGKFVFVDQSVLTHLAGEGKNISEIDLSHRLDAVESNESTVESPSP